MPWMVTALAAVVTLALLYTAIHDVVEARSYGERVNWWFLALVSIPLTLMLVVLVASTLRMLGKI